MHHFVILSGCSGGGKSTLLEELRRRGHRTVEEPGRRIVSQEMEHGGQALPWIDLAAFARRAVDMALEDLRRMNDENGLVFFDRGLVDAAAALHEATGETSIFDLLKDHRYHRQVFLTPPWPEIYVTDPERQYPYEVAINEYQRLCGIYPRFGYAVTVLPKTSVSERADLVLAHLAMHGGLQPA